MTTKHPFTPEEQAIICIAPLALVVDQVMIANNSGIGHAAGVYKKVKSEVMTADGHGELELVAVKIPVSIVMDLVKAYAAMKGTEWGEALTKKYLAYVDEMAKEANKLN